MQKFNRQHIYDTAKELTNKGRWGDDDQIGTLNNISPQDIIDAGKLIKKGKVFALGLDLKEKRMRSPESRMATAKPICAMRMMRLTYPVRGRRSGTHFATSFWTTRCTMIFPPQM